MYIMYYDALHKVWFDKQYTYLSVDKSVIPMKTALTPANTRRWLNAVLMPIFV